MPSLEPLLTFFDNAFDHQKAEQDGIIIPSRGVVQELDEVDNELQQLNNELDDYLHQIQIQFHSTYLSVFCSHHIVVLCILVPIKIVSNFNSLMKFSNRLL